MGIPYLQLVSAPASEAITLSEAKSYLRVDSSDEDTLITDMIVVAREFAERYLQRSLITQSWQMAYDDFAPAQINLLRGPVQSITSVKLIARDATETTVDSSTYYLNAGKNKLILDVAPVAHRVEVIYVAGYGAAVDVPEVIKQGILEHIAQMYENRGEVTALPVSARSLYSKHKVVQV